MLSKAAKSFLVKSYTNPKSQIAFTGVENVFNYMKAKYPSIKKSDIKTFLSGLDIYTFSRESRKPKQRKHVNVSGPNVMWELDLLHLSSYSKANDGVKYLLIVIDVFSRFIWLEPLKSKNYPDVKQAIQNVFKRAKMMPQVCRTDRGSEFTNSRIKEYLNSLKIKMIYSSSQSNAAQAERGARSIKSRILKYMNHKNSERYIHVLQDFARAYNNTTSSITMMAPRAVTVDNAPLVELGVYFNKTKQDPLPLKTPKYSFKIGDYVKVSLVKASIRKFYDQTWSSEIFKVTSRSNIDNICMYKIEDLKQVPLSGSFYQSELLKVPKPKPERFYRVEKIVGEKMVRGKRYVKVHFKGYSAKHRQWIPATDLKDLH